MAGFVPKDKMSKKARKELNRQRRKSWEFSPVTRVTESRKVYNRKRKAHDRYEDYGMGSFFRLREYDGSDKISVTEQLKQDPDSHLRKEGGKEWPDALPAIF